MMNCQLNIIINFLLRLKKEYNCHIKLILSHFMPRLPVRRDMKFFLVLNCPERASHVMRVVKNFLK